MNEIVLILFGMALGAAGLVLLRWRLGGRRRRASEKTQLQTVFERVCAAGRLVGLEVYAREIATSTRGLSWMPPLILSKARLAMIFHFEKQYAVDLSAIAAEDVREIEPGRFAVALPPIEGALRLVDVTPYDIAAGKALGLIDVIPMDAEAQKSLMARAQEQAARLYERHAARYEAEARRSVERQVRALLSLFNVRVELRWSEDEAPAPDRSATALSTTATARPIAAALSA